MKNKIVSALIALLTLLSPCFAQAENTLAFRGSGDITEGRDYLFSTENGDRSNLTPWSANKTRVQLEIWRPGPTDGGENYHSSWTVLFQDSQELQEGLYTDAVGGVFKGKPLLDIYGDGRGASDTSGWFHILDIEWNPDATLKTLAVDFQTGYSYSINGMTWESNTLGSLRINSEIPLWAASVPEPSPILLAIGALAFLGLTNRKR